MEKVWYFSKKFNTSFYGCGIVRMRQGGSATPKAKAIAESDETSDIEAEVEQEQRAKLTAIAETINKEFPEGNLTLTISEDKFQNRALYLRLDARGFSSDEIDSVLEKVKFELLKLDYELGKHIRMGFAGEEQADGWYLNKIDNELDK